MVSPSPLRALSAFEATARLSSVSRAAQELGVSASAISQHIKWLEGYTQRQLFQRDRRPMALSEVGYRLFSSITGAFSEIDNALNRLEPTSGHRTLSIRTSPSLTAKWLIHQVKPFREQFPEIELRMDAVKEHSDFDWSGFDVDIRSGTDNWPGLFSYPVMDEEVMPMCSPEYLNGSSIKPEDISDHTVIYSEKSPFTWSHWFQKNQVLMKSEPEALRLDRSFLSIEAATQGLGITLESTFLAARELEAGLLVPAIANTKSLNIKQHWIVCPYQRLRSPKVRTFIFWLWEQLPKKWKTAAPDI